MAFNTGTLTASRQFRARPAQDAPVRCRPRLPRIPPARCRRARHSRRVNAGLAPAIPCCHPPLSTAAAGAAGWDRPASPRTRHDQAPWRAPPPAQASATRPMPAAAIIFTTRCMFHRRTPARPPCVTAIMTAPGHRQPLADVLRGAFSPPRKIVALAALVKIHDVPVPEHPQTVETRRPAPGQGRVDAEAVGHGRADGCRHPLAAPGVGSTRCHAPAVPS